MTSTSSSTGAYAFLQRLGELGIETLFANAGTDFPPIVEALSRPSADGRRAVRAIAVSTPKRSAALPDVPTVAESGLPDYKYDAWFSVLAPAGTPKPILNKVSEDIARILQIPEVAERLTKQGVDIVYNTPDVFDAVLKADVERNSAILRAAGIGGP